MILNSRWPFALQKYPSYIEASNWYNLNMVYTNRELENRSAHGSSESTHVTRDYPKHRHLSLPSATCGGNERR